MTTKRDSSPFASLAKLREQLPEGPKPAEPRAPVVKGPARAVVRYERKHRGGKEVTIVDKLGLADAELTAWCKELKQALGCGGTTEHATIVLQGDQRPRLPALLSARGVAKVTVS